MLFVGLRIGVAIGTGHFSIIGRITVTVGTLIPLTLVGSAVNREILCIVVEGGRRPGRLTVTTGAIGRKLCRNMVRIGRVVIVIGVTTRTGIGRIVVVAVMARCAIIGNPCMGSVQRVVAVVIGEGCRLPCHIGVACGTISGNIECNVVRIDRLIIIIGMAAGTGIRSTGIVAIVAGRTICRYSRVRTRERVVYVVVKCGGCPGSLGVARCTVSRELLSSVIRCLCLIVVVRMAARTGVGCGIVVVVVA